MFALLGVRGQSNYRQGGRKSMDIHGRSSSIRLLATIDIHRFSDSIDLRSAARCCGFVMRASRASCSGFGRRRRKRSKKPIKSTLTRRTKNRAMT